MLDTTVNGTAVNAANGLGGLQIIAKTGTTSNYLSGFFLGAVPQYAMVVGMFVNEQDSSRVHRRITWPPWAAAGSVVSGPRTSGTPSPRPSSRNLTPQSFPRRAVLRPAVEP